MNHRHHGAQSTMIYKTIQDEKVPALGLGTWELTGDDCVDAVEHALDLGYRHIDTAQAYDNEEAVGRGIANSSVDRDEVFLTTKIARTNVAEEDARRSTEESLRRLGTDYVDLLLIHWPVEEVPVEETLDAMRAMQEDDLTRRIGVSNFTPSWLQRALDYAFIFCNQVEYHPFLSQQDILSMAQQNDLLVTAYSPLAHGELPDDAALQKIAEKHGKTPEQATLRWLLQQDHVAAIPKASSAEHREANLDVFDFELSREDMHRIHNLSRGERFVSPDFAPAWE